MSSVKLIPYSSELKTKLTEYLDKNRKYNVELDPLKLRTYESEWAFHETQKIINALESSTGQVYFIALANEIIGFLYYYIDDDVKRTVHVSKIYIDQDYRNRGYGTDVIQQIEMILKDLGYKYISINVFIPNTKAVNLYNKLGYNSRFMDMLKKID